MRNLIKRKEKEEERRNIISEMRKIEDKK